MSHWKQIKSYSTGSITDLFGEPGRVSDFSYEFEHIYFDFSKTHIDEELLSRLQDLAKSIDLKSKINALLDGEAVNTGENRAAEHSAERGIGAETSVENAQLLRNRMKALIEAIDAGALGEIDHIIHLGIGGSALGPELLIDALKIGDEKYETAIVSNIDGAALETGSGAI